MTASAAALGVTCDQIINRLPKEFLRVGRPELDNLLRQDEFGLFGRTARQLTDQSTTLLVESPSTSDAPTLQFPRTPIHTHATRRQKTIFHHSRCEWFRPGNLAHDADHCGAGCGIAVRSNCRLMKREVNQRLAPRTLNRSCAIGSEHRGCS